MKTFDNAICYWVVSSCTYSLTAKKLHNVDSNCFPLSVVMVEGIPTLEIQPFTNVCETDSAVILVNGKASGQRVKRSIQVNK